MARLELEVGTDVLLLETGDALLLEAFGVTISPPLVNIDLATPTPALEIGVILIVPLVDIDVAVFIPTIVLPDITLYPPLVDLDVGVFAPVVDAWIPLHTGAYPYTYPFLYYLPDGRTLVTSLIQNRKFITTVIPHRTFITEPKRHRKFITETGQY